MKNGMQPQNFGAAELPRKVASGEELEVQICPYGEYEKSGVVQKCDRAAFQHILNSFDGQREVLVDFDHDAESGGSTRAAAWLELCSLDPPDGDGDPSETVETEAGKSIGPETAG